MSDIIKNPLKKRRKKLKRPYSKKEKLEAFRPTEENRLYLEGMYNKSEFIDKAVSFYILLINKPIQILKELKRRFPKLYKSVGRRKF
ncbi:hypothetical protein LCGC14_1578080 [marine sediment metagenome]|uniref:Uncharacterized protein n=1 Tax=marine sediment metagenome TaxID=412755 RepID=A0A0F9LHZ0_9ZZZZ